MGTLADLHVGRTGHHHGRPRPHEFDENGRQPIGNGQRGVDNAHAQEAIGMIVGIILLDARHNGPLVTEQTHTNERHRKQAAAYLNDASRLEGGEQEHEGQAQKENIEQGWVHSS